MSAGAFEDNGDAVIEMDVLPPRWLDIQDEVTEWLDTISRQMKRLEQMHQKHVLPGFDDDAVKQREEREIEALTQDITKGFQNCQKAIRRIDAMLREAQQQGGVAAGEETLAQNLKISLATRVGDVSALFRKKQTAYMKSESGQIPPTRKEPADGQSRDAHARWHGHTPGRHLDPDPEPIHRPVPHGLRNGPDIRTVHPSANQAKAALHRPARLDHRPARARDRTDCAGHHRPIQHLPGAADHGHRPGHHARPHRLQRRTHGQRRQRGRQGTEGRDHIPEENHQAQDPAPARPARRRHVHPAAHQTQKQGGRKRRAGRQPVEPDRFRSHRRRPAHPALRLEAARRVVGQRYTPDEKGLEETETKPGSEHSRAVVVVVVYLSDIVIMVNEE